MKLNAPIIGDAKLAKNTIYPMGYGKYWYKS